MFLQDHIREIGKQQWNYTTMYVNTVQAVVGADVCVLYFPANCMTSGAWITGKMICADGGDLSAMLLGLLMLMLS